MKISFFALSFFFFFGFFGFFGYNFHLRYEKIKFAEVKFEKFYAIAIARKTRK
jgi:hypothetical protein